MTRLAAAGLVALLLSTTAMPAVAQTAPVEAATSAPNPALATLLTDYEAFLKANDPISAGQEGDVAAKARLPDISRAAEVARQAPLEAFLARARALPTDGLSSEDAAGWRSIPRAGRGRRRTTSPR